MNKDPDLVSAVDGRFAADGDVVTPRLISGLFMRVESDFSK